MKAYKAHRVTTTSSQPEANLDLANLSMTSMKVTESAKFETNSLQNEGILTTKKQYQPV